MFNFLFITYFAQTTFHCGIDLSTCGGSWWSIANWFVCWGQNLALTAKLWYRGPTKDIFLEERATQLSITRIEPKVTWQFINYHYAFNLDSEDLIRNSQFDEQRPNKQMTCGTSLWTGWLQQNMLRIGLLINCDFHCDVHYIDYCDIAWLRGINCSPLLHKF